MAIQSQASVKQSYPIATPTSQASEIAAPSVGQGAVTASPPKGVSTESIQSVMQKAAAKGFSPEIRRELACGWRAAVDSNRRYVARVVEHRKQVVSSFEGAGSESRIDGMKTLVNIRKEMAISLFRDVVRPEIEKLMRLHGDERSFDEVVCIFGFNRLFMRDVASAGTDIDFMISIDSRDKALIEAIQFFMIEIIRPKMHQIGVDMEAADYLIIDLNKYLAKFDDTQKSLFTLANADNVHFITGSPAILQRMFTFSDQQLVEHYVELVKKNRPIENEEAFKKNLLTKLARDGQESREMVIMHLRQMANSELYIGKNPYKGKKTVQTVFAEKDFGKKIKTREKTFSIKYCLNRIVDLHNAAKMQPEGESLTGPRLAAIERLALVLSNISCRLDPKNKDSHPALAVQEGYSDITLAQMAQMNPEERQQVAELLKALHIVIDPKRADFAEKLYDSLWLLGRVIHDEAQRIERDIIESAYTYAITE